MPNSQEPELFVCAIASSSIEDELLNGMRQSAAQNAVDINIHRFDSGYKSFFQAKVEELSAFLNKATISGQVVMYVDSTDVLFLKPLNGVVDAFRNFSSKIVFGAEKICFPAKREKEFSFDPSYENNRFLNAGCFIAERDYLLESLEFLKKKNLTVRSDNDQSLWIDSFLDRELEILLDYKCEIFQNCSWKSEVDIERKDGVVFNSVSKYSPYVLHYPGGNLDGGRKALFGPLQSFLASNENSRFINPYLETVKEMGPKKALEFIKSQ